MAQQLSAAGSAAVLKFMKATAQAMGVEFSGDTLKYTITPSVLQTLQEKIVLDGAGFLALINIMPVSEMKGQKLFMDADTLVSGRTDTTQNDRVPVDPSRLTEALYELYSIETEVAIRYALIDTWAKFPNFAALWNAIIRKSIANDRLRIGWLGTHAALATNKTEYPNGEDVAPGWLHQIRQYDDGAQYVDGTDSIILGSNAYPNLDYLVSVTKGRLPQVHRNNPNLVACVGADLAATEEQAFYKVAGRDPQQKEKLNGMPDQMLKTYGGLPCHVPPYFPDGGVLVTTLDNLSIYYQDTSWRRTVKDKPERNRYEDFSSRNEGFIVEDFDKTSLVDNVTVDDAA